MIGGIDKIKDSVLWKDAQETFDSLPFKEKVERYSNVFYGHREELSIEQQVDVMMKVPAILDSIKKVLDTRELEVVELVVKGYTYAETAKELGYKNRSSVTQIMHSVKNKLEKELC